MATGRADREAAAPGRVSVDFTFSIYNRTGKYHVGREILDALGERVAFIHYWRHRSRRQVSGRGWKVVGRLTGIETDLRIAAPRLDRRLPRLRSPVPTIHLDPLSVVYHDLRPRDLVLCHDVGPLSHPELYDPRVPGLYRAAYREIRARGPAMAFMSEATRRAFLERFPADYPSERVIYSTIRPEMAGGAEEPVPDLDPPFLLTVGELGVRKNQLRAVEAFARSGLAAAGVSYVLCGGREFGHGPVEDAVAATPGVRFLGRVPDPVLRWLYRHATGFVLPSLLEGFGVPVAEAAARGVVPLVTAGSVLEEVAGDGAIAVEPTDVAAIAAGMARIVAMAPEERALRAERLAAAVRRFDRARFDAAWRAAADDLGDFTGRSPSCDAAFIR